MSRHLWVSLLLLAAAFVSIAAGVAMGSQYLSPLDVLEVVWNRLSGDATKGTDAVAERIVLQLRLPRVLLALTVGGGLSIVGVAMQTLVRNPLAEPYVLGVSTGAAAGASLFYLGFLPPLLSKSLSIPLAAFIGGLVLLFCGAMMPAGDAGLAPHDRRFKGATELRHGLGHDQELGRMHRQGFGAT